LGSADANVTASAGKLLALCWSVDMLTWLGLFGLLVVGGIFVQLLRLQRRQQSMEFRLMALLRHAQLAPPLPPIPQRVLQLATEGESGATARIKAIKELRAQTGIGLAEAKAIIEEVAALSPKRETSAALGHWETWVGVLALAICAAAGGYVSSVYRSVVPVAVLGAIGGLLFGGITRYVRNRRQKPPPPTCMML
jgi:hypothetical protein